MNEWLTANGLTATTISPAGDWIAVSMPVSQASSLFDAEFSVFTHQETGQQSVRTLAYSIPAALLVTSTSFTPPSRKCAYLHVISFLLMLYSSFSNPFGTRPVVSTSYSPSEKRAIEPLATCSTSAVTPTCVQSIYGIPKTLASSTSNKLAVSGFIEQYANQADLTVSLITPPRDAADLAPCLRPS